MPHRPAEERQINEAIPDMIRRRLRHGLAAVTMAAIACPATAANSDELGIRGTPLTPVGAKRAASEDGRIPRWEGGITSPPEGVPSYADSGKIFNPFPEDEPQLTITADNYERHAEHLTRGQQALFETYPDNYKMKVYESRRTAAYPERIYRESIANTDRAELSNDGNGVDGTVAGYPFPRPANGIEAMWNHVLRYNTTGYRGHVNRAITNAAGDYVVERTFFKFIMRFHRPETTLQNFDNKNQFLMSKTVAPSHKAGEATLVHVPLDRMKDPAQVWVYNRAQRRIRRVSRVGYDNPFADGLMTHDQIDMFNGPTNRYNWKLVGKKKIYVPYNDFDLYSSELTYDQIVQQGHINQDLVRYELHRMWVVEATVKDTFSHIYPRRIFYIDEDSWHILLEDMYDERGEFWRTAEAHAVSLYDVPVTVAPVQVHYDLQSRRYVVLNMTNEEEKPIEYDYWEDPSRFSPMQLRRFAERSFQ